MIMQEHWMFVNDEHRKTIKILLWNKIMSILTKKIYLKHDILLVRILI